MRKIYFFILLFIGLAAGNIATGQNAFLTGKWMMIEDGDTGFIEFDKNGYLTLIYNDFFEDEKERLIRVGGKNFLRDDGVSVDFKYSIDTARKPHHLDFITYLAGTDTIISFMAGIYEIIGPDIININISDGSDEEETGLDAETLAMAKADRPKAFNTEARVLTRIKK